MTSYSIDLDILRLELLLTQGNTWPTWTVNQPSTVISISENGDQQTVILDITVTNNRLIFSNTGKSDTETIVEHGQIIRDQTLAINRLWANNILLENSQINNVGMFYPAYQENNINYAKENNIDLPKSMHQLKFYYNGDWIFEFERPFFIWYNHLLMDSLTEFNHWFKKSHLGIADDEKVTELNSILMQLND